MLEKTIF